VGPFVAPVVALVVAATGVPHWAQNFDPSTRALPQVRHEALSALPHSLQNLAFGCAAAPHLGQFIRKETLARSPAATEYRLGSLDASANAGRGTETRGRATLASVGAFMTFRETFRELAQALQSAPPSCGRARLVAVDGPGGAGKSVFAARLAQALGGVPVIHTDDFASWDNPHGWWPRFEEQFLGPLRRGQPLRYQRYDWNTRELGEWIDLPETDVLIVEGVSSSRAAVKERLTMAIWIEAPREVRLKRGIERDGESMRPAWDRWMAEEDAFFARDRTRERADLVVDGSPTLPHDAELEFVALESAQTAAES
jgi:uridine kinase